MSGKYVRREKRTIVIETKAFVRIDFPHRGRDLMAVWVTAIGQRMSRVTHVKAAYIFYCILLYVDVKALSLCMQNLCEF